MNTSTRAEPRSISLPINENQDMPLSGYESSILDGLIRRLETLKGSRSLGPGITAQVVYMIANIGSHLLHHNVPVPLSPGTRPEIVYNERNQSDVLDSLQGANLLQLLHNQNMQNADNGSGGTSISPQTKGLGSPQQQMLPATTAHSNGYSESSTSLPDTAMSPRDDDQSGCQRKVVRYLCPTCLKVIPKKDTGLHSARCVRCGDGVLMKDIIENVDNQFRCPRCSKTFTRGTTLRDHIKTRDNERPYSCGVCKKSFTRRKDCRRHEGAHSGDKFTCQGTCDDTPWGCGQEFTRKDALSAHLHSSRGAICLFAAYECFKRDLTSDLEHISQCLERPMGGYYCRSVCLLLCELDYPTGYSCEQQFDSLEGLREHIVALFQFDCLREDMIRSFLRYQDGY